MKSKNDNTVTRMTQISIPEIKRDKGGRMQGEQDFWNSLIQDMFAWPQVGKALDLDPFLDYRNQVENIHVVIKNKLTHR